MSTNGSTTCEDAEMADCDGEKVVTMMDVLKEQEDFEEDANAVLGASDDKNCTYSKGYIKRQAIYACMTCCADAKNDPTKWAGVCLACSLTCHENHDLIELYTKRNFRCDCGNPKFNSHSCQFTPDKTDLNVDNIYNQNFSGVYCVCHRPYPDPELETPGDMIQCIACEDWLHSNHLDAVVPPNDQYSEMICKACMDKNEFLHDYSDLAVNKENMDVDILSNTLEINTTINCLENGNKEANENMTNVNGDDIENKETKSDTVDKLPHEDDSNTKQRNDDEPESAHKQASEDSQQDEQTCNETLENSDNQNEINTEVNNDENNTEENNIETEEKHVAADTRDETFDNVSDKQMSPLKEEVTVTDKTEKTDNDNRSQEQVEEDLLLADPMEMEQKEVDSSHTVQSNDEVSEKTADSEAMDTSEPVHDKQIKNTEDNNEVEIKSETNIASKEESEKVVETVPAAETDITAKHAETITSAEQTESMTTDENKENMTEQLDTNIAITTENMTSAEAANKTTSGEPTDMEPVIKESKEGLPDIDHSNSDEPKVADNSDTKKDVLDSQSETTGIIEQSEKVPTTEVADNLSSKDMEQKDAAENFEPNVSNTNEESATGNNVIDGDKSMDNVTDDNNTEDSEKNDIPNNDDHCDKEVLKVESDLLKRKISVDADTESDEVKKPKRDERQCVRPKGVKKVYHGATFWPSNFRHKLCTCNECISMYKDLSVLFLIDPEDTVTAYETLGKDKTDGKPASQYEKGMAALSSLGHVQQINALTEYAKLRDKLLDFLKTFKEKKVIVKEEDIKAFFAGMKPVREPDGVYFCR